VALDHAGEVLIGQHMGDLKSLGPWTAQGAKSSSKATASTTTAGAAAGRVDDDRRRSRGPLDLKPGDDRELPVQPGPFGLRVGMTRAQAMARFPKPPVSARMPTTVTGRVPHLAGPGFGPGIRVELFEGQVTRMYWGTSDAIELIEGCA
jgi:hypothetical protein